MRPATQLISLPARRTGIHLIRQLTRRSLAVVALLWLAVVLVATLGAPWLAPHDPFATQPALAYQGPSGAHLLGTDQLGRDLLSRLMVGGADPLQGVAIALTISMVIGVTSGVLAGYLGSVADWLMTRWADITMALPGIILLLVVLAIFPGSSTAAMVAFGILLATPVFRVVRASTIAVRPELHIDAARTAGVTTPAILRHHVLPRITGAVMVQATLVAGATILLNTSLGFLGFGPQPPNATWGSLVSEASSLIAIHPWMVVPTGGVITLTVLALHVLGDSLRDILVERWQGGRTTARRRRATAATTTAAPDPTALLSVRDLTVEFEPDGVRVLDGVSFDIAPGETVGLVGESGCGKSLTGRAVIRLLPAGGSIAHGSIVYDGRDLTGAGERTMSSVRGGEITHIAQDPMLALDPTFTVGAQLREAISRHEGLRGRAAHRRAVELLGAVHIHEPEDVARRYPHQISGGMAQRVVIARALAGSPRLLIADEPTTALDVTVQAEILDLLRDLQERFGMAILLISHDWGVIADICDRALVMYAGQIIEAATVTELHERPRHPYTEALQASHPHRARPGQRLPALAGQVPPAGERPAGCRFAPRCRYATDECSAGPISLRPVPPARLSRCLHVELVGRRDEERMPV